MMDALQVLRERRSVRVYDGSKQLSSEILEAIVDCGRLACTARNEQPWEFVVVTDPAMRARIADITQHGKHIAGAAACIAVFCSDTRYYLEDGSAATQNILNAAWALGVGGCWVAGDKKEYAGEMGALLGVPADKKLVSLIALGHPAAIPAPPKRALKDVLHWECY